MGYDTHGRTYILEEYDFTGKTILPYCTHEGSGCENIDFILAVGGGSVIDGTKFITIASYYEGDSRDLLKYGFMPIPCNVIGKTVPFGTVLTLPATGSEMNSGAVISYEHGKFPVMCELAFPKFSILRLHFIVYKKSVKHQYGKY